jgi:spore coat polysaccharide biosynthesis protein SpsF
MKTAILVTARLKSTRFPMKAIKLIKGRPMICHLLDRLKLSNRADEIIICTSPNEQDDPLVKIAREEGVKFFRGHPDDVLLRLTNAAQKNNIDLIISCTADNPFVEPLYIDKLIDFHVAGNNDYSDTEGLPFGTFSYALSFSAMVKACEVKDKTDTEVWGGYFTDTGLFKWDTLKVQNNAIRRPGLRLTVDYPEDFALIEEIFNRLYKKNKIFSLAEIVALCDSDPKLEKINMAVSQIPGKPIRIKIKS